MAVQDYMILMRHYWRFVQLQKRIIGRNPMAKINTYDQSYEAGSCFDEKVVGNYSIISLEDRIRLIQMVCLEKQQIVPTASSLGIKTSTAKHILKCFKKDGKILLKNFCSIEQEEKTLYDKIKNLKEKVGQACKNKNQKLTKTSKAVKRTSSTTPSLGQTTPSPVADSGQNLVERTSKEAEKANTQQKEPEPAPNADLNCSSIVYFLFYNASPMQSALGMWY